MDERLHHVGEHYNNLTHAERYFSCEKSKNIRDRISHRQFVTVFSNLDFTLPSDKPVALDIGCSSGRYTIGLREKGINAIGIDTALIPLKYASERIDAGFIRGSATSLPFKKESFDLVICIELLHHFTDNILEKALEEISTVIKPDGIFIFDVKNKRNPLLNVAYSSLDSVNLTLKARTLNQMTKLIRGYGFQVIDQKGVLFSIPLIDPYVIFFTRKEG